MKNKAVFLDRDGVINPLVYHAATNAHEAPHSLDEFSVFTFTVMALLLLKGCGFVTVLISNQPDYALGKAKWDDIQAIANSLKTYLDEQGKLIDEYYYCYHHPKAVIAELSNPCTCRKPGTLFVNEAVDKFGLDVSRCFFVGDSVTDVQCGQVMRMKTIFIDNDGKGAKADFFAENILEAAKIIEHEDKKWI